MLFEDTKDTISTIQELILENNNVEISILLKDLHYTDIAEILDTLNFENAIYLIKFLDRDKVSSILTEVDDDVRSKILEEFSSKEIALIIDELATDDAADIIASLSDNQKTEVIANLNNVEHAKHIVDLLRYAEDSAGGIMGKELVKVYEEWSVFTCIREMRKQAVHIDKVNSIYVVDSHEILQGTLSLKSLLTTSTKSPIKEVYNASIISVTVDEDNEEVGKIMQKYDLIELPVIDELGRLVGRITIDDVVDIIKEEAEKDYQIAAGLTDVEADDTILELIKGRLPWLILGLFGGIGSVLIMQDFEDIMHNDQLKGLFFFTPLIAAMAGNVGVQSSAIIVQGLANDIIKGSLWSRLLKEIILSLIHGVILALLIMVFGQIMNYEFNFSLAVAISLISVIIIASLIGTFVPIVLHKRGIDPALATGPFITTSNDIFGIFIFFFIAKIILGF